MAFGSDSKVILAFKDGECDAIILGSARVYGGASKIMELMSVIQDRFGKYDGEIPSNFDGLPMITDIAVIWFPSEDVECWSPFFLGVTGNPSRGSQGHELDPISDMELGGQAPITNHGIPVEVVRDHFRPHMHCLLFCVLAGRWSTRPRHKVVVFRFLEILEMILDMGHSFVGLLLLRAGLCDITQEVLNHLDRTWFSGFRQPMNVSVDQLLIINLVRTSVDLWANDIDVVRMKNCSTPLKEIAAKIKDQGCQFTFNLSDHIARMAIIVGSKVGWLEHVQFKMQFDLQLIFQMLVGTLVSAIQMLGITPYVLWMVTPKGSELVSGPTNGSWSFG